MGILDEWWSGAQDPAEQASRKESAEKLYDQVVHLIAGNDGSMTQLSRHFQEEGLGGVMGSWVSTEANTPISPQQMAQALGKDKIREIAKVVELTEEETEQGLAKLVPVAVDCATPNGSVPSNATIAQLLTKLKSKLLGF